MLLGGAKHDDDDDATGVVQVATYDGGTMLAAAC